MNVLTQSIKYNAWTGLYWYTLEAATRHANEYSKEAKVYHTAIRGKPERPEAPAECWAITNQYDVNVIEFDKDK